MSKQDELKVQHRFEGKIDDNYKEFLESPIMIGFTQGFEIGDVTDQITYPIKVRGFDTEVTVYLGRLKFGKNNEFDVTGMWTSRVDIDDKLPMGGFGSYSHQDTAKVMQQALVVFCKKHDMMICEKLCSWPFSKAIIQPNHFID